MNVLFFFGLLTFLLVLYYTLLAWAIARAGSVSFEEKAPESYPKVSVLVAARNEAGTITRCLQSLAELDYPPHLLQILIGNDQSTDATAEVVKAFIKQLPTARQHIFELIDISPSDNPNLQGKANVLHQLMQKTDGSFVFVVDADTQVPAQWIKTYLQAYRPGVGIATAFTIAEGKGLRAQLQTIDWTFAQIILYTFFRMGRPLTALGNNMMICPKAYRAVGGYAHIPFHVTEDYALSRSMQKAGYRLLHLFSVGACCRTLAMNEWKELLKQRRRWIEGLFSLPLSIQLVLALPMLWGITAATAAFYMPMYVLQAWLLKWLLQSGIVSFALKRLRYPLPSFLLFLLYEVYVYIFNFLLLIYTLFQRRIHWKNRTYDAKRIAKDS